MNISSNIFKSSVLAWIIFWLIITSEGLNPDAIPFMVVSIIPITIIVTFVILISIATFFWLSSSPKIKVFKTYYPYCSVVAFSICTYGIISSDFNLITIAFFASAFITTSQSWGWFAKD